MVRLPNVLRSLIPVPGIYFTKATTMRHLRLALVLAPIALAACAGPHSAGSYQSRASYDQLYSASLDAVSSIGYTVTSSNKADGLIVGSQGVVLGRGSAVGLNAYVSNGQDGLRTLQVNITAPPGSFAFGNFDENLQKYVATVHASIPDLKPAS